MVGELNHARIGCQLQGEYLVGEPRQLAISLRLRPIRRHDDPARMVERLAGNVERTLAAIDIGIEQPGPRAQAGSRGRGIDGRTGIDISHEHFPARTFVVDAGVDIVAVRANRDVGMLGAIVELLLFREVRRPGPGAIETG